MSHPSSASSRQPLSELPLHTFVAQALQQANAGSTSEPPLSPTLKARSRPSSSRSVSPHKQAVLQRHQHRTRPGSSSSSQAPSSPIRSNSSSPHGQDRISAPAMATLDATPVRRKLFSSAHPSSSGIPLEYSPVLPASSRYVKVPASVSQSLASASKMGTPAKQRISPFEDLSRPDIPATPTDAPTTPRNARQHRPSPVSGPKPKSRVEPSPSTERHADTLLLAKWAGLRPVSGSRPTTPVPKQSESAGQGDYFGDARPAVSDDGNQTDDHDQELHATSSPDKKGALKSLPKKKFRVSKTEVAIAHEIAGAGPMGSPSPCKIATYPHGAAAGRAWSEESISASRRIQEPGSPRRRSQPLDDGSDIYTLTERIDPEVLTSAHIRKLSASKLFGDFKLNAPSNWSVYEDPVVDSKSEASDPSQDHNVPSTSCETLSVPSTPNKENKRPRAEEATVEPSMPIVDVDADVDAGVPSAPDSARRRGTGGRLSLVARAEDEEDVVATREPSLTAAAPDVGSVTSPPKRSKLIELDSDPLATVSPVRGPAYRSPEATRGRRPRKTSASAPSLARKMAIPVSTPDSGVASRTRSKSRPAL